MDFRVLHQNLSNVTRVQTGGGDGSWFKIDSKTYWYFNFVNAATLGQAFALFGVATNIINIVMFVRMGFKDPINVSLLGLSISDFMSCVTLIWMNLTRTPGFTEMDFPFEQFELGFLTGTWPHFIFIKTTSCITTFITFERCLCVAFPLKIKELITTKRVTVVTLGLFFCVLALAAPNFYYTRLENMFSKEHNRTLLRIRLTDDIDQIEPTVLALFGVALPLVTFILTIIFTVVLVLALKKSASFRNKATTTVTSNNKTMERNQASPRDVKVSRMVIMISALFIACYLPIVIFQIFIVIIPEFRTHDPVDNIMFLIFSFIYYLETTNASFNIIIYYKRSSKYKTTFDSFFYGKSTEREK